MPNIVVIGHKRHGKDAFCEMLRDSFMVSFAGSSYVAAEEFLYKEAEMQLNCWQIAPKGLVDHPDGTLMTLDEFYEARNDNREWWFDQISRFCVTGTELGDLIFNKQGKTIYCGCRNYREYKAMKDAGMIDLTVWVDASSRRELESPESFNIPKSEADVVIDNNGPEESLFEITRQFYINNMLFD